jgi:hypothetical protein
MQADNTGTPKIDIPRWFSAMKPWVHRGRYFWTASLLPVLLLAGAVCIGSAEGLEDRIRLSGLTLNVLGLVVVAIELARTQGQFKGRDASGLWAGLWLAVAMIGEWVRKYFREIPRWRFLDVRICPGTGSISAMGSVAGVGTGVVVGKPSLEQRVELLETLQKEDREAINNTRRLMWKRNTGRLRSS